ncbi:MAG TPA: hypothetical protein VMT73_10020 [Anaerolineales bacterium]|nr:hypothetical protein [Anaerolineales bacterium]
MAHTVILHIAGENAVAGEIEEIPKPTDTIVVVSNPRTRDGKDLHYLEPNVTKVIWPISKLTLIEVLAGEEEEKIIGFVRE